MLRIDAVGVVRLAVRRGDRGASYTVGVASNALARSAGF
jgi:hypothetical protein